MGYNSDLLSAFILAAQTGGKEIKKYFGKNLVVESKSIPSDFRTLADTESEKAIIKILSKRFPSFNILSEEVGFINNNSEYTLVIDPLDGSNNFVLGLPFFSVSIGLLKNQETVAGVIYQPLLEDIYYAEQGKGAFLNKKRLHVSNENEISKATISYSCGYINSFSDLEKIKHELNLLQIKRILELWAPALEYCLLATGKIEAIINNKNDLYDYVAGKIIAEEAGAYTTNFKGGEEKNYKDHRFIISNGPRVHNKLLKVIKEL